MKRFPLVLLVFSLFLLSGSPLFAQDVPAEQVQEAPPLFVVVKNDGTRFYGHILSQDAREVLIETQETGQVYIPRHEIREIRQIASRELDERGYYVPGEVFSTRYAFTSNGLPSQKGENYILWNLFGPDIQFGVSDNVDLGIMTTWIGYPIIGTAKYSLPLNKDWNLGLGLMLGTGSWAKSDLGMALPYGAITYGDRVMNFTFSTGYGGVWYKEEEYQYYSDTYTTERVSEGSFFFSLGAMFKVGPRLSLVFDSFFMPAGKETTETFTYQNYNWETDSYYTVTETYTNQRSAILLMVPALRFQTRAEAAFQLGFAGIRADGETMAVPFPMLQWFRKL
ncbi:MAG: hypothetical protein K0B09_11825 [Bacteroidales bacterium]|nr:hypothetical protein [Bacteroidales bacterium]